MKALPLAVGIEMQRGLSESLEGRVGSSVECWDTVVNVALANLHNWIGDLLACKSFAAICRELARTAGTARLVCHILHILFRLRRYLAASVKLPAQHELLGNESRGGSPRIECFEIHRALVSEAKSKKSG